MLSKIWNLILDIVFPQDKIVEKIEKTGANVASEIPRAPAISKWLYAPLDYQSKYAKALVWELKYRGNKNIAKICGQILADELLGEFSDLEIFENFTQPLVVPAPLSKKRFRERGFNQAELLARAFVSARGDNLEIASGILLKIKDTPHQADLPRSERLKNLRNCFSVANPSSILNRNIILIDDVITTESTMSEMKKTLRKAGAKKVVGIAVAH